MSVAQTVEFFTPRTVRIIHTPENRPVSADTSVVVIAKPDAKVQVKVKKSNAGTVYQTSALTVTVNNGHVSFADAKGNPLMHEGIHNFTPITAGPDKGAFKVRQTFSLDYDEEIYGLGLLQNGKMSQRGEDRLMIQSNQDDYAHFYQTIKGYGIYWDNYSPTQVTTPGSGKQGEVALESQVGNQVDYYFMYGGDADGVIAEMRNLSGHCPMLPLWTYGFHQSRERYKNCQEVLDVLARYRRLGVPIDGMIQDWQYWGSNYTWNAMDFLNEDYADAQKMIDEIHRQHAHLNISIWASFGPHTLQYEELKKKDLLFSFETWPSSGLSFWPPRMEYPSGVRCYKPYSAEARDIYWKHLRRLFDKGVDAWWMDSTDPDHLSFKDSDLDEMTPMGSFRKVRNIFPLQTVEGVYNHQRATTSDKRVFILTRSYFAGQQRTGANTWSGDITSSWDVFRQQVPICLNFTLTANPQVNTDIGGFFANRYNRHGANSGTRNADFRELYARWMQFGAFCPMMRSHGTELYRELYYYGKKGIDGDIENPDGEIYESLLGSVKLRYRFLPYIYSQAWQVSKNDDSFMRALFMDFRNDPQTWNNNSEFMFGRNVLVCPVLNRLYRGDDPDFSETRSYEVYLPQGTDWYNYFTDERLSAGKTQWQGDIRTFPLYIKAGTILPQAPVTQWADMTQWENMDIVVYPGADADFTLYEDEGDNYNYEQGKYSTIALHWNDKAGTLSISKRSGSFEGMLQNRTFNIRVVGGRTATVSYNGKAQTLKKMK